VSAVTLLLIGSGLRVTAGPSRLDSLQPCMLPRWAATLVPSKRYVLALVRRHNHDDTVADFNGFPPWRGNVDHARYLWLWTLLQALWGDYTYSAKTKRITRLRPHKGDRGRPLFVTLALEPLWKAYAAAQPGADHKVCSFQVHRLYVQGCE
jgi:hypothetical protein